MSGSTRSNNPAGPDPYWLLGLPSDPTVEEINTAYRRALRRSHPDTWTLGPTDQTLPSLSQLQAARAHLLAAHNPGPPNARPPTGPHAPAPDNPQSRDRSSSHRHTHPEMTQHLTQRPPRKHNPGANPDLIAGPVRYHGPARSQ
jgi:hypothetical protein